MPHALLLSLSLLPPVSLRSCILWNPCRYFEMLSANQQAAELALELYSDCVRWLLLVGGGYECQVS